MRWVYLPASSEHCIQISDRLWRKELSFSLTHRPHRSKARKCQRVVQAEVGHVLCQDKTEHNVIRSTGFSMDVCGNYYAGMGRGDGFTIQSTSFCLVGAVFEELEDALI